ncbi:MAG TPA: hypothetical protein VGP82_04025 [Ktedonobacterales bacterium]|jgi:hypothetical protein|nr:hypothetical protein [Ktedonobacterales bacterium]
MPGPNEPFPFWAGDTPREQSAFVYPTEHMPPEYQPGRKSPKRHWPWLACGVVLGVLLVPCLLISLFIGFSVVFVVQSGASLDGFCADLTAQRYDAAHNLLSSQLQAQVRHARFVQVSQQRDEAAGVVRSCQSPRNSFSLHNTDVTLQFEIVRSQTYKGTVTLIHQSSGWKVNRLDPELALLPEAAFAST